jgi:hypothetical protein
MEPEAAEKVFPKKLNWRRRLGFSRAAVGRSPQAA